MADWAMQAKTGQTSTWPAKSGSLSHFSNEIYPNTDDRVTPRNCDARLRDVLNHPLLRDRQSMRGPPAQTEPSSWNAQRSNCPQFTASRIGKSSPFREKLAIIISVTGVCVPSLRGKGWEIAADCRMLPRNNPPTHSLRSPPPLSGEAGSPVETSKPGLYTTVRPYLVFSRRFSCGRTGSVAARQSAVSSQQSTIRKRLANKLPGRGALRGQAAVRASGPRLFIAIALTRIPNPQSPIPNPQFSQVWLWPPAAAKGVRVRGLGSRLRWSASADRRLPPTSVGGCDDSLFILRLLAE